MDLRSGELLWERQAAASSAGHANNSRGGLLGLPVKAVVDQTVNSIVDRSRPMARLASQRLLGAGRADGLPYGPRSPHYGKP